MHRIRPGSTAPGGACLSAVLSAFLLSPALMTGCSDLASEKAELQAILGCDSQGNAHPICGFSNPEDLAPLPGDQALLVSEYGGNEGQHPGGLVLFAIESEERRVLFRGGDTRDAPMAGWGDPSCPGAPSPAFSPHGIDLVRRDDGKLQLLVVQHRWTQRTRRSTKVTKKSKNF